jgi:hypothetical protein
MPNPIVRTFNAKDSNGKSYTIVERRVFKNIASFEGTHKMEDSEFETEDGGKVIQDTFETYRIIRTGVVVAEVEG